ncbi:MAG: histidine--tRNA ligase [Coxiellaceae bacterium]|jgi:histidyl-tRNA synthetase|nr:histidine--tRNA ligase [Coxiellaceae bacterium]
MKNIRAIRGMSDILPNECPRWVVLENLLRRIAIQYGYCEIRVPIVESTELFSRAIGEVTDIVSKEMYTFLDRSGDSLTLRPEGTASCIRAGIEHGLFYHQIQRLFYCGPMFRHERPQKGRYRQFHQFGVEAYGLPGPDIDVEMMLLSMRFWQELKIDCKVVLQINTLGTFEVRAKYRKCLIDYFNRHYHCLDDDSCRRLSTNPLRILDSKNPEMRDLIQKAPKILDFLDKSSKEHFTRLCKLLDQLKLPYVVNPCLVRGLDYYNLTVFEWTASDDKLSQNTICAGGHYDNLVTDMGGKTATPAIGFALGLERLHSLVATNLLVHELNIIHIIVLDERSITTGMLLSEDIRNRIEAKIIINCDNMDLSVQLRRANKGDAKIVLILGMTELATNEVLIKYLRENKPQKIISSDKVVDYIHDSIK